MDVARASNFWVGMAMGGAVVLPWLCCMHRIPEEKPGLRSKIQQIEPREKYRIWLKM
jgi:hypothetical protein